MFSHYNHSLVSTHSVPAFRSLCSTFLEKPVCILFTSNLSLFTLLPRQGSWICWRKTHHITLNMSTNVKWVLMMLRIHTVFSQSSLFPVFLNDYFESSLSSNHQHLLLYVHVHVHVVYVLNPWPSKLCFFRILKQSEKNFKKPQQIHLPTNAWAWELCCYNLFILWAMTNPSHLTTQTHCFHESCPLLHIASFLSTEIFSHIQYIL